MSSDLTGYDIYMKLYFLANSVDPDYGLSSIQMG